MTISTNKETTANGNPELRSAYWQAASAFEEMAMRIERLKEILFQLALANDQEMGTALYGVAELCHVSENFAKSKEAEFEEKSAKYRPLPAQA